MMPRKPLVALALAAALLTAVAAGARAEDAPTAGSLTVVVSKVPSEKGSVVIALFPTAEAYDAKDPEPEDMRSAFAPIEAKQARITFEEIPFGDYALRVFHDENGNEELDTNWVGYPKEAFGFSNDAMGRMGPPSFDEARFRFGEDGQVATVNLND